MTRNEAILLAKKYKQLLQDAHIPVMSVIMFGSAARDQMNEHSDIDFLVEFEPGKKSFDNFMNLSFFLEEISGRKIELVTPQSLSKYLGPHILKQIQHVSL